MIAGLFGAIVLASPAQAHHPIISGKADCLADGQYRITWTVGNGDWQNPYMKITTVTAGINTPLSENLVGRWLDPNTSATVVQLVPGDTKEATLNVKASWYRTKTGTAQVNDEATGVVKPTGVCQAAPPTATGESTCDSFTITISNPAGGNATEATVTYGTQSKKVTVAPGKTEKVELSPSSEKEAVVTLTGLSEPIKVAYEKPANCGGLPRTGSNITTYIASGTGLAALGGVVFFLARRRMVKLRRLAS
jgi:LPXTG-motif cell wall-anchored protein